jgi:hypothetical protein
MNTNTLPVIAGNFIASIQGTIVEQGTVGAESTVFLLETLPDDIVQAISSQYPIYAALGCRTKNTVEYVLIKKGSYNAGNRQIILIRGQSPYYSGNGGQSFRHTSTSGGIQLNFFTINPFAYRMLVDDVNSLKNGALELITSNLPKANTSTVGGVRVSYNDTTLPIDQAYKALTTNNPLIEKFFQSFLAMPDNSTTLEFDGTIDANTQNRLNQLRQLFDTMLNNPTKFANFISDFNNRY